MSDYTVYIDEAGDLGIGRGTRWFVLTAVVVKKTVEPQIRGADDRDKGLPECPRNPLAEDYRIL